MRILCVSPFFPPIRDSESFCGGKMVLALQEQGAEVTTLYSDVPYLDSKQDDSRCWAALRASSHGIGRSMPSGRLRAAAAMARYLTVIWPRWVAEVVRTAARLHQFAPFDLVYSRSLPMFAHIAGCGAARALRLPWIANINDPWDEHLFPGAATAPASPIHAVASRYWLKRTLASADAVTFPNVRIAKYTLGLARSNRAVEILPHVGWSNVSAEPSARFKLVHAGKLGFNEITGRSTRALLTGLRDFLDAEPSARSAVELQMVGPQDPESGRLTAAYGLSGIVAPVGQVNYEQSLGYIASASACLLIEGEMNEGIYLPSKLADYIAARKPVLALSPKVGVVADLQGDRGVTRVDQRDEGQIAGALSSMYRDHVDAGLSNYAPSAALVDRFRGSAIAEGFLELASRVAARESKLEGGLRRSAAFDGARNANGASPI